MNEAAVDTRKGFWGARGFPFLLRVALPGVVCLNVEEIVRPFSEASVLLCVFVSDGREFRLPRVPPALTLVTLQSAQLA